MFKALSSNLSNLSSTFPNCWSNLCPASSNCRSICRKHCRNSWREDSIAAALALIVMTVKRPGAARCLATGIHVSSDRHSYDENLLDGRAGCTRFFTLIINSGMVDADKYISCSRSQMRNHLCQLNLQL